MAENPLVVEDSERRMKTPIGRAGMGAKKKRFSTVCRGMTTQNQTVDYYY